MDKKEETITYLENNTLAKSAIDNIVKSVYSIETRGRKPTGQNIDKGAYHKITISMTEEEKRQIQEAAQERDESVSKMIKRVLEEANILK